MTPRPGMKSTDVFFSWSHVCRLSLCMISLSVTIQVKAAELYIPVVVFILLFIKKFLPFGCG